MKTLAKILVPMITLVIVLAGCSDSGNGGTNTVTASFSEDFHAIPYDVDGDGDTTYTVDGDDVDDIVFPGGGRILTYDKDNDGTADQVNGKYWRIMSRRFAVDDGNSDLGGITDEVHLSADTVWFLEGSVFIGENTSVSDRTESTELIIEEGTTIKGIASSSNPGTLIIDRNGQIDATGTAADPIVFTSSKEAGKRSPGDWGGIVINGNARVQGNTATGEGDTGVYGGSNDDDNSGTLEYVLVQFAGTLFTPENELNGIAFQGVGGGTSVDYIQVHQNADDGVEFFGGSVQVKHVVLTGNEDDSLDFDDGWNGSAQFVVIQQYPGGDYAIEGDGDALDVFAPANPVLANFTIIGPTAADEVDGGPRFKENSDPDFYNSLIINYANATPQIREETTTVEYFGIALEGGGSFSATRWDNNNTGSVDVANGDAATWPNLDHIVDASTLPDPVPYNFQPTSVDAAATAQSIPAADSHGNALTDTDYLGAVDPSAGTDWTSGWIQTPAN